MTTRDLVRVLEEAWALDPVAVRKLLEFSAPCNKALADHYRIVVDMVEGETHVSMLGLINGLAEDESDRIVVMINKQGLIVGFGLFGDFEADVEEVRPKWFDPPSAS
jgi:hypothetical protein